MILRYALPIFLVGFVALGIVGNGPPASPERSAKPSQVQIYIEKLDRKLAPVNNAQRSAEPSRSASFLLLLVVGVAGIVLHYWATSLKLAVQFQALSSMAESWRLFLLDGLRFADDDRCGGGRPYRSPPFPAGRPGGGEGFRQCRHFLVSRDCRLLVVGILAGYAAALVLLLFVRALERSDRGIFKRAADLTGRPNSEPSMRARKAASIGTRTTWRASPT